MQAKTWPRFWSGGRNRALYSLRIKLSQNYYLLMSPLCYKVLLKLLCCRETIIIFASTYNVKIAFFVIVTNRTEPCRKSLITQSSLSDVEKPEWREPKPRVSQIIKKSEVYFCGVTEIKCAFFGCCWACVRGVRIGSLFDVQNRTCSIKRNNENKEKYSKT